MTLFGQQQLVCGIRGVNYKKAFTVHTWEKQQTDFAWILLNSTIPIFEGWLEELKGNIFTGMNVKDMQYPSKIKTEVTRLTTNRSSVLENSFYTAYSHKRDRCYSSIEALMHCYRIFKEARNCYMHNAALADNKLVNAYNQYLPFSNTSSLDVDEVPQFFPPVHNEPIQISLRGVVGFSYIVIKIIVSLDAELLRSKQAESEFIYRYKLKHSILRTLKTDSAKAKKQVAQYVQQCGMPHPQAVDEIMDFLLSNRLISR